MSYPVNSFFFFVWWGASYPMQAIKAAYSKSDRQKYKEMTNAKWQLLHSMHFLSHVKHSFIFAGIQRPDIFMFNRLDNFSTIFPFCLLWFGLDFSQYSSQSVARMVSIVPLIFDCYSLFSKHLGAVRSSPTTIVLYRNKVRHKRLNTDCQ